SLINNKPVIVSFISKELPVFHPKDVDHQSSILDFYFLIFCPIKNDWCRDVALLRLPTFERKQTHQNLWDKPLIPNS
ncbi:MAG: hypothetical protein AAFR37_06685, partial [Cyanobacteria bacterium J06628_3]